MLSEQLCMRRITNDDLVCKDCLYCYEDSEVYGNTSTCEVYDLKPSAVIYGKGCDFYEKGKCQ